MKSALLLKHLQGLFQNPRDEWEVISKDYHEHTFHIIAQFFLIYFAIVPIVFALKTAIGGASLRGILFKGVAIPLVSLVVYLFVMYLLAIVIEEATEMMKGKVTHLAGSKVAFFSALPLLSLLIFAPIPYLGALCILAGFLYQIFLIIMAGQVVLAIPPNRRFIWIFSIFVALLILLFLFALLLALVSFFSNLL